MTLTLETKQRIQLVIRWVTAANFIGVGVLHFTHDHVFLPMMPPFLPWHLELVWLSGLFEILGGIGLLVPFARRFSAWGLLALVVAVFPANVHMAMNEVYLPIEWLPQSKTGLWVRLPFQLVIAVEVWLAGLWVPGGEPAADAPDVR